MSSSRSSAASMHNLSRTFFTGDIAEMNPVELVQTLESARKSGTLYLRTDRGDGQIWFRDGKIVDATCGQLAPKAALFRLLAAQLGQFRFEFGEVRQVDQVGGSTPGLLLEAMRRVDESGHLLAHVRSLDHVFVVDENALELEVDKATTQRTLAPFRGDKSLAEIRDHSFANDVEFARLTSELLARGLLVDTGRLPGHTFGDRDRAELSTGAASVADMPVAEALPEGWPGTEIDDVDAPQPFVSGLQPRGWALVGIMAVAAGGALVGGIVHLRQGTAPVAAGDGVAAASLSPPVPATPCPQGMVLVEGGNFFQGSQSDRPVLQGAKPAHKTELSGFCLDTTEVTVGAYRECSRAGHCERAHRSSQWPRGKTPLAEWKRQRAILSELCNENYPDRSKHPMNCVTWQQAHDYCAWREARLPSEAEWEFAARGSDGRIFPWGDESPHADRINACGIECRERRESHGLAQPAVMYEAYDGYTSTAPVGSFPGGATTSGVYDLIGNVFEWTQDRYGPYAAEPQRNPRGAEEGKRRVIRGGAFNSFMPEFTDPALRFPMDASAHTHGIGFRCAAAPDE